MKKFLVVLSFVLVFVVSAEAHQHKPRGIPFTEVKGDCYGLVSTYDIFDLHKEVVVFYKAGVRIPVYKEEKCNYTGVFSPEEIKTTTMEVVGAIFWFFVYSWYFWLALLIVCEQDNFKRISTENAQIAF